MQHAERSTKSSVDHHGVAGVNRGEFGAEKALVIGRVGGEFGSNRQFDWGGRIYAKILRRFAEELMVVFRAGRNVCPTGGMTSVWLSPYSE